MSGEYLVLVVGNLALMAGGAAALGLGERYIPRYLRERGGRGGALVMAAAVAIALVYAAIAAFIVRFGLLGFRENIAPFLARGDGRGARHLIVASLFVCAVVVVYVPVFFHQRVRRAGRSP